MSKNILKERFNKFCENQDFELNRDNEFLDQVLTNLVIKKEKEGQYFCPCRLRDGSKERDIELLCPCNFKIQENWKKRKDCWCGLFQKLLNNN